MTPTLMLLSASLDAWLDPHLAALRVGLDSGMALLIVGVAIAGYFRRRGSCPTEAWALIVVGCTAVTLCVAGMAL